MISFRSSNNALQTYLSWMCRISLLALFIYSGLSKVIGFEKFSISIARSPLITDDILWLVAYGVPIVELICSILLWFDKTKYQGFILSFFLLLIFTLYIMALIILFTNVPCSCGGIFGSMSYPVHIAFNIFFTLVALVGIYTSEDKPISEPQAA